MLQVRVVNSDTCELRAVEGIVARHVAVTRREWDRKLSYSLAVAEHSVNTRAEMVAEVLVSLYQLGTDPGIVRGSLDRIVTQNFLAQF